MRPGSCAVDKEIPQKIMITPMKSGDDQLHSGDAVTDHGLGIVLYIRIVCFLM